MLAKIGSRHFLGDSRVIMALVEELFFSQMCHQLFKQYRFFADKREVVYYLEECWLNEETTNFTQG